MTRVRTSKIIRSFLLLLLFFIMFMTLDFRASTYANGIIYSKKDLPLQTLLERINGVWITYEGGLSLLAEGENFRHSDGSTTQVDRIHKYATFEDGIAVAFQDSKQNKKTLYFSNIKQVIERSPTSSLDDKTVKLTWINVLNPPTIFYYWKPAAAFLFLVILLQIGFTIKQLVQK